MTQLIKFTCPNGHKLSCSADRVGHAGKCPTCGVRFEVPKMDTGAEAAQDTRAEKSQDSIFFLCPNGHELHGPAKLAGRPGQCPYCAVKFQIPSLEELQAAAGAEKKPDAEAPHELPTTHDEVAELPEIEEIQEIQEIGEVPEQAEAVEQEYDYGEQGNVEYEETMGPAADEIIVVPHPLATVFSNLWSRRDHGSTIEIHLGEKEQLKAERFAPRLSQANHGVFGVKESDGSYTLIAIPWEQISRILLRGLDELPEEMFD